MKHRHFATTLGCCLALVPLSLSAQDEHFDSAKMQALVEKYGSPGPEHKLLDSWAGRWKTENTFWMMPGGPAMKSTGTVNMRPVLGGRYLQEVFKGTSEEMGDFEGRGTHAYDRVNKEFVTTWIDSMSTGIMISRGKMTDDKTIELRGTNKDYFTMQDVKFRTVIHILGPDKHKMQMFATYPDQEEFQNMEIIYTRVAGGKKQKKDKDEGGAQTGAAVGAAIGGGDAKEKE